MAFIKSVIRNSGVEINYWKISEIDVSIDTQTVEVVFNGYISKAARLEGKEHEDRRSEIVTLDVKSVDGDILPAIYTLAKTLEFFDGALDD